MNRTLFFGIALFLAVVGYGLTGAEKQAEAGRRCHGCNGCAADCAGDCGAADCNGRCHRDRCHRERCHRERCHRCHRRCNRCNGDNGCNGCNGDCGGEAAPAKDAPKEAPKETSIEDNAPLAFRAVSFVR